VQPYAKRALRVPKSGREIVICISRPRNHCLKGIYREKNCHPRLLAAEADNFEDVKGFRGQGVHKVSNINLTLTLMAVVKSNGRELGFPGLFLVREVLVSRTVAQKRILL
jgi:hypothetical protein